MVTVNLNTKELAITLALLESCWKVCLRINAVLRKQNKLLVKYLHVYKLNT